MITEQQNGKKRVPELYEIIESIAKSKTPEERVTLIRKYAGMSSWTDYLRCVFDDRIQFNLPGGEVPYTPAEEQAVPTSWHKQNVKLQYFVKGSRKSDPMHPLKRETMFIGLLEVIHPKDAEILSMMINKKAPEGLEIEDVKEGLPKLL
jgi:hypothetical protein